MKWLVRIVWVLVLGVITLFIVENRQAVSLTFLWLPWVLELPLYLLMVACFVCGFTFAWLGKVVERHRLKHTISKQRQRILALENQVEGLQHESSLGTRPDSALLP